MKKRYFFEALECLYEDQSLQAYKDTPVGRCYLRWIERRTEYDEQKQLAFINEDGFVNYNFFTELWLDLNSAGKWTLVRMERVSFQIEFKSK